MFLRNNIFNIVKRSFTSTATMLLEQEKRRLKWPISVAPMVDISTPYFLELLHIISGNRYAYYTEMHFDQAIIAHQNHLDAFIGPPRSNVIVQLGGSNPENMAKAAKILQDQGYSEVNINVGCPSKAVQSGQFGAVLMKSPDIVANVLNAMQEAVSIPVTVKCRLGVDNLDSFDFLHEFVDTCNSTSRPIPHLILHARKCLLKGLSPKQNRAVPPLNYDRVYQIAEKFPEIPISINGGFTETGDIANALNQVDGCMIGRKVMDNPLFLQKMDRDIYEIPDHEIKSPRAIISEYLDYIESLPSRPVYQMEGIRIPPLSILIKPLTMLYTGKKGRDFRRHLMDQMRDPSRSIRQVVQNALDNANIP